MTNKNDMVLLIEAVNAIKITLYEFDPVFCDKYPDGTIAFETDGVDYAVTFMGAVIWNSNDTLPENISVEMVLWREAWKMCQGIHNLSSMVYAMAEAVPLPEEKPSIKKANLSTPKLAIEQVEEETEAFKDRKSVYGYAIMKAEKNLILDAIRKAGYNKSKAAILLGMDRKTLYNKLREFQKAGLALILGLFLMGCEKQSQAEFERGQFTVELLFEHDGCRVYRFRDNGYLIYFSDCKGSSSYKYRTGGKHPREVSIQSITHTDD